MGPTNTPQQTPPPTQIPSQPPQVPQFDPAAPKVSNLKLPFIIGGIVVALAAGLLVFMLMQPKNPQTTNNTSQTPESQDSLMLTPLIDPNVTLKDETITADITEQVDLSGGVSLRVTSVDRDWQPTSSITQEIGINEAAPGKRFLAVYLQVGNRDEKKSSMFFSTESFKLENAAGKLQDVHTVTSYADDYDFNLITDVKPGKQTTGILVFEVSPGETPLTLIFEESYIKGLDDVKKIRNTAKITLQ